MVASILFNVFFVVVINSAYTCFKIDKDIINLLWYLTKKASLWFRGRETVGETALVTSFWGMLYADDLRVVS